MIEAGTDKPCIASAIIKGDNDKLNDGILLSYPADWQSRLEVSVSVSCREVSRPSPVH